MTITQYGVRFPYWGDRPMPNEYIARRIARFYGHPLIVRDISVTEWAVTSCTIPRVPTCGARLDETDEGGLNHPCARIAGHDGVHHDGRGQMWVDLDGRLSS